MAQIELENIARTFSLGNAKVCALSTINVAIEQGEYIAIMGPSGSGKSTLLNLLGLLDQPDAGCYRLEGRDVTTLSSDELAAVRRQRIGFIFQSFHLIPRLTAAENIALPLVLAGVPPAAREKRARNALAKVGLQSRAGHRPDELSGGQRQRIAIARAIIMRPAMLLADEPTGNLDRHTGQDITELLESLNAAGTTLVIVTHDPIMGRRARRRLLMVDGVLTDDKGGTATDPPPGSPGRAAAPHPFAEQR
ncbi:MAG: ABC transporter ATP-binding protein [Azoarcus sp.]|jgi:putative ABC transport system ATP-binding protein|nr:ABC transporter ATP-binding protein [Azoarcus sp.]